MPVHLQSCQSSMFAILSVQPPTFRLRFSSMIFAAFRIRSFLGRRCSGCAFVICDDLIVRQRAIPGRRRHLEATGTPATCHG
jgi:hypothetical protein